ncbi:MAG: response regulator [Chitinivibrionales bacterium]|nr:response regulator [Chitinivibrionales bacterium]
MKNQSFEIAPSVYWVGSTTKYNELHCNPYLMVDHNEGVLIDPGSVLDFDEVLDNVSQIVSIDKIKYIVLQHQDPDLCASTPLFEKHGFTGEIATYWRTAVLLKYYGIRSPFYLVNEHDFSLNFSSGRRLNFLLTPYLHFPGAIVTYDHKTKILFSSDLFGAMNTQESWNLYADETTYVETMKLFHEHYMPSHEVLGPVMEQLLLIDIHQIAPQHGSIINKNVRSYIEVLRDLECGAFLNPIKKEVAKNGGYVGVCNSVLKRLAAFSSAEELLAIFKDSDITIAPETLTITDFSCSGPQLWNTIFDLINASKGLAWLSSVEILVRKLCAEYSIALPSIFESSFFSLEKITDQLAVENKKLKQDNIRLQETVAKTQDLLMRCPITGLYNSTFFMKFIDNEVKDNFDKQGGLLFIKIDTLNSINISFGIAAGNETLVSMVYLLEETCNLTHTFFKLDGALFGCFLPGATKTEAIAMAEKIRSAVYTTDIFLKRITVSISVVAFEEFTGQMVVQSQRASTVISIAEMRQSIINAEGPNRICSESRIVPGEHTSSATVIIIDTEPLSSDMISHALQEKNITVLQCDDGQQAINLIQRHRPDVIIAEIMVPKVDGFVIRELMLHSSELSNIPFVLISHIKNEETIYRAVHLGITYYLQKPYFLMELLGIVDALLQKAG